MARTYGTGSARKLPSGNYQLRWVEGVDPFSGQKIVRTETVEARNISEARKMVGRRASAKKVTSRILLGQLIENTLPDLPVAETTRNSYRYALAHVPQLALEWVAADITVPMAAQLFNGLAERHPPQTVRKCYTALMSCWKQARLNGWVDETRTPWSRQRLPKVNRSAGSPLTVTEVRQLMAAAEGGLERCWLTISLATGARPGEVVGLRWSHIDLDNSLLTFIDAKHDGQERPVAIDSWTESVIGDWMDTQAETSEDAGLPLVDDPWLISSEVDASRPWARSYAGGFRWRKVRDRAGIRETLRLYDLRHTNNSELSALGFDSATRGDRIGNSPATNLSVYTHSMRDHEAATAIGDWLSRAASGEGEPKPAIEAESTEGE